MSLKILTVQAFSVQPFAGTVARILTFVAKQKIHKSGKKLILPQRQFYFLPVRSRAVWSAFDLAFVPLPRVLYTGCEFFR